jgi:L-threonylcarbamoyladenylate synthase
MPSVPLAELLHAARSGTHLISFPTDTVPALAVRPDRSALIFAAKQRSQTKPLILMGGDQADLWPYVRGSEAELVLWQQVAERYWPGALTLVLPASDRIPPEMNPTNPTTIGIRVPNHPIARHILSLTQPLATTSVNRSGEPPLETLAEINQHFPEVLTLHAQELDALEQGTLETALKSSPQPNYKTPKTSSGVPSTVVKWTGQGWEVLRQGGVAWQR